MRILLVEDDPIIAMAAEATLLGAGHDVIGPYYDAAAALRGAGSTHADVAIVDINLASGVEGIEVARDLFKDHGIRSLFATAQPDIARDNRDAAIGVLTKPYSEADLVNSIPVLQLIVGGGTPPPPQIPRGMEVF